MEIDDVLMLLGKWGRWQLILYIVIGVAATFPACWNMLDIVFLGGMPEHHCNVPEGANINSSIPLLENGQLDNCHVYANQSTGNSTMACPDGWQYMGEMGPTIVSEWDLVCDKSLYNELAGTINVIGIMVGALVFTALADYLGRKPTLIFAELTLVIIGTACAFSNSFITFTILRFFIGALLQGIMIIGFVMACELWPSSMRTFAGMALQNMWSIGMMVLALMAFYMRDWRHLQLAISLPAVLTIAFFWVLPESIPWLCANGREQDADKILRGAAKFNNVTLPEKLLSDTDGADDGIVMNADKSAGKKVREFFSKFKRKSTTDDGDEARYNLLYLFKNRTLLKFTVIMTILWLVNSMVYYGLSLNTSVLAGNRYLNFFLSGLVEIPAYTIALFVLLKWGRRWPVCIFHVIAGVALIISTFIPAQTANGTSLGPVIVTFAMIGKFGITGSYGIVYLYTPELFPTTVRSQVMGLFSVSARIGLFLATVIQTSTEKYPWLIGLLFGVLSIGVGTITLLLPETLNRPLPQTIEEIEGWSKQKDTKEIPAEDAEKEEML